VANTSAFFITFAQVALCVPLYARCPPPPCELCPPHAAVPHHASSLCVSRARCRSSCTWVVAWRQALRCALRCERLHALLEHHPTLTAHVRQWAPAHPRPLQFWNYGMNDLNRLKLEHGVHVYFSAPQKTGSVVARAHFQNKKVRLRELKSSTYSSEAVAVEAVREYIEPRDEVEQVFFVPAKELAAQL